MAAEVIPPQMSKVNGIIRMNVPRFREIMTAINKREIPIDLKIIFFTWQVQIQYNLIRGIPVLCCHFIAYLLIPANSQVIPDQS